MTKRYYIYILSNFKRNVLYVGITNNLVKRVWQHKQNMVDGFTKRYNIHYLMHFEMFSDSMSAIEREKQIKSWPRKRKDELLRKFNPGLRDLYQEIV